MNLEREPAVSTREILYGISPVRVRGRRARARGAGPLAPCGCVRAAGRGVVVAPRETAAVDRRRTYDRATAAG